MARVSKQSKNSRQRVSGAVTEEQAIRLRMTGASYAQIGKALGCTKQNAHRAVTKALKDTKERTAESTDQLRAVQSQQIDALTMAMWPAAQKGDAKAVLAIVRLMRRRAVLMGLDAPKQTDLTIGGEFAVEMTQEMNFGGVKIKF